MEILFIGLILAPVVTIFMPFAGGWLNFILDSSDGDMLIPLGLANDTYQPIDKIADWVTYICMVVLAYRSKWPFKKLILGLFLFRSIGQILFLTTHNELFLFFFPNFLEPLVLVTATIMFVQRVFKKKKDWFKRTFVVIHEHRFAVIAGVFIYKMQDEFFTHVSNTDRTEFIQKLFGG